ncbi:MAG: hypothetical protein JNK72_06380 [Myxococcales bacterium]|nr:hypothetical protein [Myxococcales bacterium]
MFDQLLNVFGQSRQGQQAYQALQAQGYSPQQSAGILSTAFPVAAQAVQQAIANPSSLTQSGPDGKGLLAIGDSNYAMNFLGAAVTSLVRGHGMKDAAVDGLQGVVGGHVAQVIASRCGLPERVAGVVGAVITPMMIDFLWEKFQGMGGGAQAAAPAGGPPGFGSNFTPFNNR